MKKSSKLKQKVFRSIVYHTSEHPCYTRGDVAPLPALADYLGGPSPAALVPYEEARGDPCDAPLLPLPQPGLVARGRDMDNVKLLREYLLQSLPRYCYFSIDVATEVADFPGEKRWFQLLDFERKDVLVNTELQKRLPSLFTVSVQPLQRWCGPGQAPTGAPTDRSEVYIVEDPRRLDMLSLAGAHLSCSQGIHVWHNAGLSDVDGCVALSAPHIAKPDMMLNDKSLPVLSLVQELRNAGFCDKPGLVEHTRECRLFDSRRLSSKGDYLRCVLTMDRICSSGVHVFRSDITGAACKLLLHDPAKWRPGMSAKDCKAALRGEVSKTAPLEARACLALENDDDSDGIAGDVAEPLPSLLEVPHDASCDDEVDAAESELEHGVDVEPLTSSGPALLADGHVSGSAVADVASEGGADGGVLVADVMVGADCAAGVAISDADVDDASLAGDLGDAVLPGADSGEVGVFVAPLAIEGETCYEELRVGHYHRLRVYCPVHKECNKSRSVILLRRELGLRAAEAFLGCWLLACDKKKRGT